ncbi:GTP-binding protein [Aureimonas fodinaquatilis]|uniref:GTP-binding protein n=1 Tax=Aureimonas fodinaquatilis TaxID=2565783 RepID=A0A5B0DXL9_9HYPH|nr:GTP-binding protein [Aureimonas fodinaquatilis]KAA0971567.1 GTP-binding protein [Aureimonas fodinaquatilis]
MQLPIRVTVLTGFLGAGKTTMLNALLRDPALSRTAVIVNEFGEAGLDHLLVEGASEGIIELSNGCVCCTVRGELVDRMADLADRMQTGRMPAVERVVIETTGLADPAPVLAALMAHPALSQIYALDGVVTLVDAHAGLKGLEGRLEAERQVAVADRLVLTKTDLSPADPDLLSWIRHLNPRARILDAASGEAGAQSLLNAGLYDPETRTSRLAEWLNGQNCDCDDPHHHHDHHDHSHHHHTGTVRALSLVHKSPVSLSAVQEFIDLLQSMFADKILRMKAMVHTLEHPDRPLVLHGVRRYMHPPVLMQNWPQAVSPHTRLVVIGEGLDPRVVEDLFAAFTGQPRIDAPDRAALTQNPLAIPGM